MFRHLQFNRQSGSLVIRYWISLTVRVHVHLLFSEYGDLLDFFEWVSDCCLTPTQQFCSYIVARTSYAQWNEDEVRFVLDQHA
jgi:hypothetical protein